MISKAVISPHPATQGNLGLPWQQGKSRQHVRRFPYPCACHHILLTNANMFKDQQGFFVYLEVQQREAYVEEVVDLPLWGFPHPQGPCSPR